MLAELQEDINIAIQEVQTAVSTVLKSSTGVTLEQYEDHINAVQAEYEPYLERLQGLKAGDCKNDAEFVLNRTTTNTGYRASNCASEYDTRVKNQVDIATRALVRFDDIYSQVQSIVVKAFIGQNAFLTPEDIKLKIVEIYEIVSGRWEDSKPEVEAIKRNLASGIAAQNVELGNCHKVNLDYAKRYYEIFREDVNTCTIFDNTPNPFGLFAKSSKAGYVSRIAEIKAMFEKDVPYVWQS